MATYVLVHGGAHGGWCYKKVKGLLETRGNQVYAPTMTGLGERSHLLRPDIDLDFHVEDIVSELFHWDLRDVIMVGHSYGGMVITGVSGRVPDRVGKLVYLDAATPSHGMSLVDVTRGTISMTRQMGETTAEGIELVLLPKGDNHYGVQDPAEQAWMNERLHGHPWKCFEQPVHIDDERAFAAIPKYHIVCTSTIPNRDEYFPEMMAAARAEGRLWDVDTGHDLMLTEPEFVATTLEKVAAN